MPRCPSCFTALTRVEEDTLKWSACQNCFGNLISYIALCRRTHLDVERDSTSLDATASLADLAEVVAASNSTRPLRCPQCEKAMAKDRYHPMIPITIDRCKPCGLIWLDAGELTLLRRLYRELMTSDDPEILRRREKLAGLNAQINAEKAAMLEPGALLASAPAGADSGPDIGDAFNLLTYFLGRM
jgi:Zn-finger nucleic acid-binding protein